MVKIEDVDTNKPRANALGLIRKTDAETDRINVDKILCHCSKSAENEDLLTTSE